MSKKQTPPLGRTGRGEAKNCDPPKDHGSSDTAGHKHDQSTEKPSGRGDPFTPDGVFTLLQDILKGDTTLPRSSDPAIADLASVLRTLRWKAQGWIGPWPRELEDTRRIAEAIGVLTEILPIYREIYEREPAAFERFGAGGAGAEAQRETFEASVAATRLRLVSIGGEAEIAAFDAKVEAARVRNAEMEVNADRAAAEARARLAAFNALVEAARAAHEIGLPMIQNPILVMSPITQRWRDFGQVLAANVRSNFPWLPMAAVYRFIAAVTPEITGEHPTMEAVKTEFKKRRFPEQSFARLKLGKNDRVNPAATKIVKRGKRPP